MFTVSTGFVRPNICSVLLACFSAAALSAASTVPQLQLSTTAIGPVYVESGVGAPGQTINAFNIGAGALSLSVSSSAPWLTATVGAVANCSGGPQPTCNPIQVSLSTAGLAVGTYTAFLTVSSPGAIDAPQNITVTVQVNGTPTSVNLYVTPTGGPTPTAAVTVNTGNSVKSAITTSDGGPWLTFMLSGGGSYTFYTPYQLKVTAEPGQAGTYTGTVALSGSQYSADNQTINVNMNVTSQPIVPSSTLTYNLVAGQPKTTDVTFQNIGLGTLSINGVNTSGGGWLSASLLSSTTVAITIDATLLTPGTYTGSITLSSNAANSAVPIPIQVNVSASGGPVLSAGGVVDNAAFDTGAAVASGSIAAVFGSQLSPSGPTYASSLPLPTTLAGVQILVNGIPAPIFYVDANQADIQVPFGLTAGQMVLQAVVNGQPGNQISAPVDSIAPRLFALKQLAAAPDTSPYGIVLNSDGTLALPANLGVPAHPAQPGETVTIYALGLGPVSPSVANGSPGPASAPLATTVNTVQVLFGGGFITETSATPSYAGLAPNFVGLYQINVTLPQNVSLGNIPVMLVLPGHSSNFIEMAIQAGPQ